MKKYLLILLALCLYLTPKAQKVTVCGTDTIVLQVEHYVNGIINWEESLDSIAWVTIPDAIGETYKFFPTQTKYYRASVKTTDCDPLISAITLVQLPPKSYAGSDREFGGNVAKLLGSNEVAASGIWSVLEGTGGSFDNPASAYAKFTGAYDKTYKLLWTVTNGCGQSQDTVAVILKQIVAKNNYIVVDNTDLIFGDSTERAAGIYRIKFSDPSIQPTDTMLLIGMREDISFICKIQSFSLEGDVYVFTTAVGGLEDIIQSGTVNVGDAVNEAVGSSGKGKYTAFPTRKTLKAYQHNTGQVVIYAGDLADRYGNRMNASRKSSESNGLQINIPDMTLFSSPDGFLSSSIANTYVRFEPNFVSDFEIGFFTINNIKIGLDNAEFEYNYKFTVQATAAKTLSKEKELLSYSNNVVFMVGPVPVLISMDLAIKAAASLNASAVLTMQEEKNYQKNFTALLVGDELKNVHFVSFSTNKSTSHSNYSLQGSLGADFSLGPEISVELYKVIGPYFELPLSLNAGICVNQNLNWSASTSLGIEGNLGIRAHLGSWSLFDFKHTLFRAELINPLIMPYKIDIISGNFQKGIQNQLLTKPIKFKVSSSYGLGVPLVPVHFSLDNGNGSITQNMRLTDTHGIVELNDWTLGANPENELNVSVLNCDNEDIDENSPLTVYASSVHDCANTDFAISLTKTASKISPKVTGGTPPYTYSTDGITYGSTVPEFSATVAGKFKVYVKDANNCNSNRVITIVVPDPCTISPLFIDVYSEANTFRLTGINGVPPYQFSMDNTSGFSANYLYSNLSAGKHTVYIKDANNCIGSDSLIVDNQTSNAISAITPKAGAQYYAASNINFHWQSGLYAVNQKYDLYLKKGNAIYSLIAQNLSIENYTYSTTLSYGSLYTWKIVVKDAGGVTKDSREFTFTTMYNPSIVAQVPTLVQPFNNAQVNTPVTLKWLKQTGDYKYDVFVDNNLTGYSLTTDSLVLNNLAPGMSYSWKVKIKNVVSGATVESPVWNFEVKQSLPTLTSNTVYGITPNSAIGGGNVTNEGLTPVTSRGICWSTSPQPTIDNSFIESGSGIGSFTETITGLTPETPYYVRAFATNSNGTAYGNQESFSTIPPLVSDGDGNYYTSIQIGTQKWLKENLKTTKYNDGTDIGTAWGTIPSYAWYNNDMAYKEAYGALYNWYAVDTISTNHKNICPVGWHVPTQTEFQTLIDYLGGVDVAGGKIKEAGYDHWNNPNTGATNESGFTAVGGGFYIGITFSDLNVENPIWTTSLIEDPWGSGGLVPVKLILQSITSQVGLNASYQEEGFSVRCLKD